MQGRGRGSCSAASRPAGCLGLGGLDEQPQVIEPVRPENHDADVLGGDEIAGLEHALDRRGRDDLVGSEPAQPVLRILADLLVDAFTAVDFAVRRLALDREQR
jgi:hypothetical protein